MTVHSFDPANQSDDADWWKTIYVKAFPEYVSHEVVRDVARQKLGIDHVLTLNNGATLNIDVKTRAKYRDDILLEVWSSKEHHRPGWLRQSLHCHYIAYASPTNGCVLLVPFHLMRLVYEKNKNRWAQEAKAGNTGLREVRADNGTYTTVSVAVPLVDFMHELTKAMTVWLDESEPF